MRAFVVHLGIFIVVVGGLAALNLYRNPSHPWFIWVLAGWGIGLAAHDLALLRRRTGRQEAIFTDKSKRGFLLHLFVYVAVNALLVVVNLLYQLIGWGLVLAAHGYLAFHRKTQAAARTSSRVRKGAKT